MGWNQEDKEKKEEGTKEEVWLRWNQEDKEKVVEEEQKEELVGWNQVDKDGVRFVCHQTTDDAVEYYDNKTLIGPNHYTDN